jgi:hypothetical protein
MAGRQGYRFHSLEGQGNLRGERLRPTPIADVNRTTVSGPLGVNRLGSCRL